MFNNIEIIRCFCARFFGSIYLWILFNFFLFAPHFVKFRRLHFQFDFILSLLNIEQMFFFYFCFQFLNGFANIYEWKSNVNYVQTHFAQGPSIIFEAFIASVDGNLLVAHVCHGFFTKMYSTGNGRAHWIKQLNFQFSNSMFSALFFLSAFCIHRVRNNAYETIEKGNIFAMKLLFLSRNCETFINFGAYLSTFLLSTFTCRSFPSCFSWRWDECTWHVGKIRWIDAIPRNMFICYRVNSIQVCSCVHSTTCFDANDFFRQIFCLGNFLIDWASACFS